MEKLPVPADKETATKILAVLKDQQCDVPAVLVKYRASVEGLGPLMAATVRDYDAHLKTIRSRASRENETDSAQMAATIQEVINRIEDAQEREKWAQFMWKRAEDAGMYFGHKYRICTDASLKVLAKPARQKMPSEEDLIKPLLTQVTMELRHSLAGQRNVKECKQLAEKINAAANGLKDQEQKQKWLSMLSKILEGKETFYPNGQKGKALKDPCADAISQLLASTKTS
jgi:hypothetical protein